MIVLLQSIKQFGFLFFFFHRSLRWVALNVGSNESGSRVQKGRTPPAYHYYEYKPAESLGSGRVDDGLIFVLLYSRFWTSKKVIRNAGLLNSRNESRR